MSETQEMTCDNVEHQLSSTNDNNVDNQLQSLSTDDDNVSRQLLSTITPQTIMYTYHYNNYYNDICYAKNYFDKIINSASVTQRTNILQHYVMSSAKQISFIITIQSTLQKYTIKILQHIPIQLLPNK